jgi:hypothetical protein
MDLAPAGLTAAMLAAMTPLAPAAQACGASGSAARQEPQAGEPLDTGPAFARLPQRGQAYPAGPAASPARQGAFPATAHPAEAPADLRHPGADAIEAAAAGAAVETPAGSVARVIELVLGQGKRQAPAGSSPADVGTAPSGRSTVPGSDAPGEHGGCPADGAGNASATVRGLGQASSQAGVGQAADGTSLTAGDKPRHPAAAAAVRADSRSGREGGAPAAPAAETPSPRGPTPVIPSGAKAPAPDDGHGQREDSRRGSNQRQADPAVSPTRDGAATGGPTVPGELTAPAIRERPAEPAGASAPLSRTAEPDMPDRPPATDRITVRLPDEAGAGRIQVSVRGDVVHARIVGGDAAMGQRLESGLSELRESLARQGFEETHVRIEAGRPAESGWAPAAAAESAGAGDSRQQESDSPERQDRDRAHREPRPDPRDQQQGRSQQRARRERERS